MFASDRMFFTTVYLGSMLVTLYLTCTKGGIKGYTYVMAASGVQVVALLWYLVSFLPGGTAGLQVVAKIICTMLQPVMGVCFRLQAKCVAVVVQHCCKRGLGRE
jgi:low temperature requirement protein LtrA